MAETTAKKLVKEVANGKPTKKTSNSIKTATSSVKVDEKGIINVKKLSEKASKPAVMASNPSIEAMQVKPKFSLEECIQRVKQLDSISNKRQKSVDTLNELRKFKFGSDDTCTIELSDSSGKEFTTGNPNLIELLTSHLDSLLKGKITELDEQIISFEI